MGATRRRLASLLFAEALLLALPAAVLAVPVGLLTLQGVAGGVPGVPSAAFDVDISLGAASLAIGVAVLSAVVCGLFPLRGLTTTPTGRALQAFGVRQTAGKNVMLFRTALASAQIALSMTLVALTLVFAQSLANIARIELGFDVDPVMTFTISPETSGYSPEASATLYDRVEQEIGTIPGVASVSSSMIQLLSGETFWSGVPADGSEDRIGVHLHFIGRDFFQTLGIDLLAGRGFGPADSADSANTVVINQRLAERLGVDQEVIGARFTLLGRDVEVIGLVANAKDDKVTTDVEPQVFFPRAKLPGAPATFYVRGSQPSLNVIDAVRAAVKRVDTNVPITDLVTLQQQVRKSLTVERFVAASSTVFAVLGTVLAGLGIYGVLAYSVVQRSREIGLRIALGAAPPRVRAMVFRQVAVIASLGIAVGVAAAFALGRVARGLLYGIEAGDPLSIVVAATVIAVVTLSASYFPARRASGVDPVVALRSE